VDPLGLGDRLIEGVPGLASGRVVRRPRLGGLLSPGHREAARSLDGVLEHDGVDDYAGDARGTVFFRVHSGSNGIGPDVMSYGFVRHPSQQGTPFGGAGYQVFHIVDDWYWFRVSDDWY